MDVSSQEKCSQDRKSLATGQAVLESNKKVNSNCARDEKVLENHENMGSHTSFEVCNGSASHEPEDITGKICSPRKTVSEHKRAMEDTRRLVCLGLRKLEHPQTKKLSQPGNGKIEQPRNRERMVTGSPRVLRSRQEKPKTPELINAPTQETESKEKKRKKMKKIKEDQDNEFEKIKRRFRYFLNRMSFEQNFVDAYVGEGWKGQSAEKIKPEKELQRAKSDITCYKLKIRDLFQRIDRSCEEGRIPESLFDSEGEIDSEDIFCAKCGQTEVRLDNDIILCDGACERGFHQFCLEPPLLKEQVPPGDEGWLCPACDCKADCIDLLNDCHGTDLSIGDSWEKVFPESVASGNNLDDASGLLSDDSGDDDYNPDGPEVEEEPEGKESDGEESSSDDSDFSSASEDLGAVANNEQHQGLSSEDSEDDDFDPDRVDSDEEAKTRSSSSEFSSDSEDLGDICKNEGTPPEVQGPLIAEDNEEIPKASMEEDDSGPITAKRHVERLDYKKLHDETYGNVSSDSSDEDFFDTEAPRRWKNSDGAKDTNFNQKQEKSESTPIRRNGKKLDVEGTSSSPSHMGSFAPSSSGTKSPYKRLGEAATERLHESFKENQYPDRDVCEKLAKESNLTYNQVRKWFENARWSFRHPGQRRGGGKSLPKPNTEKAAEKKQVNKEKTITKQANEMSPKSRKRKGKSDDDESEVTPSLKEAAASSSTRRSGRVQAKKMVTSAS